MSDMLCHCEWPVQPSILRPRQNLLIAQIDARLSYCPAADACEDELVEKFVSGCEFFGALTSLMAITMDQASEGKRL